MTKVFQSPAKYVQGPGELDRLGKYAERLGRKAFCLISEGGGKRHGAQITASFEASAAEVRFERFNGECSWNEIGRLLELVKQTGSDLMIGVGGGKIFDTAKAVAFKAGIPVIICPTIASTDAPCSALSVIYTDEGVFQEYFFFPNNPNLVLMDTEIIAKSPVRLTVSGMGDAMATYFEARACAASGASTCAGGTVGVAALGIARLCFDTLMAQGRQAKADVEAGRLTDAVEAIIEANTLLSGIGFESGGLAGAHAIHNGLTVLPECHHMQHGEKVNFGTLTQLMLEKLPEAELKPVLDWMVDVGLPVTLRQLGITDASDAHLLPVAEAACAEADTLHNMPFPVTPAAVVAAMQAADALGHAVIGG